MSPRRPAAQGSGPRGAASARTAAGTKTTAGAKTTAAAGAKATTGTKAKPSARAGATGPKARTQQATPSGTKADGERRAEPHLDDAADSAMGGELIATLDPMLLLTSLSRTVTPAALVRALGRMAAAGPGIAMSAVTGGGALPPKDTRFRDETWSSNPAYNLLAQLYLLAEQELAETVENPDVDWRTRERSRLLMTAVTAALAPTNTLAGNPAAIKEAWRTRGLSLVSGAQNFVKDLVGNRGLPAQVDTEAFTVGEDVACTPGHVVHRTDMFELIHYTPVTRRVSRTPLLLLPPAVNKYYFWDLAPGRSLIEHAVARGIDVFTIVWRDPRPHNGTWGIDSYLASALEAISVTCDIAGSKTAHVFGDCSGGMFLTMLLGHQQATGVHTIETATLGVTVIDFGEPGGIGVAASDTGLESVRKRAARGEVIPASAISDTFVWMRPNDLVFRYVVDEWLMGKKPPAFDIMFWNADGQGLPSQLAFELTSLSLSNGLMEPGGATALGTPLDLSQVRVPTYQIAGRTDHISPWKACYSAARVLGGENTFVLTPTGHVQSIIYPMGKPRAAFVTSTDIVADPDEWAAAAEAHDDSWWDHWVDWLLEHGGTTRPARSTPGNARHPAICPAPGTYVLGQ